MPLVEDPHPEVQIGREGHPQQIGNLEQGGGPVRPAEEDDHPHDQSPQDGQPGQGEAVGPPVEENEAPAEVEGQLDPEQGQSPAPVAGGGHQPHPGRPHPHEGEEEDPHRREHRGSP